MTDDRPSRGNRLVLLTIVGLPVTVILTATWLWFYVASGKLDLVGALGTANRGQLVQPPRQIDEVAMHGVEGRLHYADLPPRWTLVVANNGDVCDTACEHNLYLTRQIHVAIGKDYNRVARLYLSELPVADTGLGVEALSDEQALPDSFGELLEKQHRDLLALTLAHGGGEKLFPELRDDATTWYLVDPAGWVMMSYNSKINYKDVISDLKFLLKNSNG